MNIPTNPYLKAKTAWRNTLSLSLFSVADIIKKYIP
jgi:hypothetical protein